MTRTVWLVRHGNRADFADPTWARAAMRPDDPPLAESGIVQSLALARQLRGQRIAHLFSSPFLRAIETAHFIAAATDLRVKVEPGLSDWLSPAWFPQPPTLLSCAELVQRFSRIDHAYKVRGTARYGEAGDEALARSAVTARRLVEDFRGNLLMVGHGASILGAVAGLLGVGPEKIRPTLHTLPYGSAVKLVGQRTGWVIEDTTKTAPVPARTAERG